VSTDDRGPVSRLSARELLQGVIDEECPDLPGDLKERLLALADRSSSGRYSRLKSLIQEATRD
jgi:hypothetical protein